MARLSASFWRKFFGASFVIFVTVGTQLPFPRLLDAMDEIAGDISEPVLAQTCSAQCWPNLHCVAALSIQAMTDHVAKSRLVIGHAGIGTVLATRAAKRPLIVVPRRAELGEHRNDHQLATVRMLEAQAGVWVAWQTQDLPDLVSRDLKELVGEQNPLQARLISAVSDFVLS